MFEFASITYVVSISADSWNSGWANHREGDAMFCTKDRDNDKWSSGTCLVVGGWWMKKCGNVKLTGIYGASIIWKSVSSNLSYADMKIKLN